MPDPSGLTGKVAESFKRLFGTKARANTVNPDLPRDRYTVLGDPATKFRGMSDDEVAYAYRPKSRSGDINLPARKPASKPAAKKPATRKVTR